MLMPAPLFLRLQVMGARKKWVRLGPDTGALSMRASGCACHCLPRPPLPHAHSLCHRYNVKYPALYADATNCPDEKARNAFNCVQRAHQNRWAPRPLRGLQAALGPWLDLASHPTP